MWLMALWAGAGMPAHAQAKDEAASLKETEELIKMSVDLGAQGQFDEAVRVTERALALREKYLGPEHPDVAEVLNNLGELFRVQGEYQRAEPLYVRALAIFEKTLGPEHLHLAAPLNNLAALYQTRGEYDRAEPLHARAIDIRERILGPEHPQVVGPLNSLAVLYQTRGEYDRAEPLFARALAIREKALGPMHPDVAESLNNLAVLHQSRGEHERAEPLFARALAVFEKALGPAHLRIAQSLNNLAFLYQTRGEYRQAEPLFARALAVFEKALGPTHPNLVTSLTNMAALHWANGNTEQALGLASRALFLSERLLGILLSTGSENQKRARSAFAQSETGMSLSLHLQGAPDNPRAAHLAMETLLRRKGRVLDATADVFQTLWQQLDAEVRGKLDELGRLRSALATRLLRGPGNEPEGAYRSRNQSLWQHIDELEDRLSKQSRAYREAVRPATIEDVQARIPTRAALVELVRYRPFDPRFQGRKHDPWGAPRYAVYVLHDQGTPRALDLGEAASIDALIAGWRNAVQARAADTNTLARALDARVMAPVRALIGDARHIFLAPDGDLNLIPFAALVDEHGRFLVERYHITYLTSGRDLLRFRPLDTAREPPVIVADPSYGMVSPNTPPNPSSAGGNPLALTVEPLQATAREARALAALLPHSRVWTGAHATESRVTRLHGPEILHIATHGIWLPDVPDTLQDAPHVPFDARSGFAMRTPPPGLATIFDPMLRSGLTLAGFNTGGSSADDSDDGFLSALEATSLDLHGTRLVVLSACDTGVGEVKSGQGVYGLRRALVVAGAQTQVMSLWKVSDGASADIMEAYYRKLRQGAGRSEAMRQVQLALLHDPGRTHPFYWASFIVSGNPAPLYSEPPDHPGRVAPASGCACAGVAHTPHLPTAAVVLLALLIALRPGRAARRRSHQCRI